MDFTPSHSPPSGRNNKRNRSNSTSPLVENKKDRIRFSPTNQVIDASPKNPNPVTLNDEFSAPVTDRQIHLNILDFFQVFRQAALLQEKLYLILVILLIILGDYPYIIDF